MAAKRFPFWLLSEGETFTPRKHFILKIYIIPSARRTGPKGWMNNNQRSASSSPAFNYQTERKGMRRLAGEHNRWIMILGIFINRRVLYGVKRPRNSGTCLLASFASRTHAHSLALSLSLSLLISIVRGRLLRQQYMNPRIRHPELVII